MTPVHDVAIVGFGPAGAVAACLLGQYGLSVLVLDQSTEVYGKPRAISLDHEIMRVLQNIGVANEVQAHTEPFSASEHFGADGRMIRRLAMLAPPYPLGWTPSMVFLQPPVEKILRARAASMSNVQIRLGERVVALSQSKDQCEIHSVTESGETKASYARFVIGCDGASSTVRSLVNLELEDLGFDEPWLVVDLLANERGLAKLPKASAQFCEPARPTSYLIGTGSHRRWEIMLLPGEDPKEMERDDKVWALLQRWIGPGDATLWRRASYRFHALVAKQWRSGRVFIAGDAAHQQPPFLGQGMCQGIRDVANLSWKLAAVLQSNAGDSLLDTYGIERGAHVRQLTGTIKAIGSGICERDPVAARERDERLLALVNGVVKTVPRQDLIPGLSVGFLSDEAHSALGTLFPQPRVACEHNQTGTELLDDLSGSGWRVVLVNQACDWTVTKMQTFPALKVLRFSNDAALDGRLDDDPYDRLIETEGVLREWFTKHACLAVVVRPDHYVFAAVNNQSSLTMALQCLEKKNQ
jgi:3-(3-hydroxy-phenyl)propionate hydroxylase